MGRDKALLRVDGVPMARRVVRALLDAGANDVVCVGGDVDGLQSVGLRALPDDHPGEGPLAGFVTGLAWSTAPITLITPCDLATPEAQSFRALTAALSDNEAVAAVPIVDGAWRALPAALRTSSLAHVAEAFAAGERSFHRVVGALDFVAVDAGPLADADSPEELPGRR
jgi:molybdopterin-guanine dinucleotide biosynthesis protein A